MLRVGALSPGLARRSRGGAEHSEGSAPDDHDICDFKAGLRVFMSQTDFFIFQSRNKREKHIEKTVDWAGSVHKDIADKSP
jgi:hypothetical protein